MSSQKYTEGVEVKKHQSKGIIKELKTKVSVLEQRIEDVKAKEKAADITELIKRSDFERKRRLEQLEDEERKYRRTSKRELERDEQNEQRDQPMRKAIHEYVHGDDITRLTIEPSLNRLLQHRYSDDTARANFIKSLAAAKGKQLSLIHI